jgi:hypothetical protein
VLVCQMYARGPWASRHVEGTDMSVHLPRWLRRRRSLAEALAPYSVTR